MNACDRCGALGKTRFVMWNGSDLVFCGHHTNEYGDKLIDLVRDMEDLDKPVLQPI